MNNGSMKILKKAVVTYFKVLFLVTWFSTQFLMSDSVIIIFYYYYYYHHHLYC